MSSFSVNLQQAFFWNIIKKFHRGIRKVQKNGYASRSEALRNNAWQTMLLQLNIQFNHVVDLIFNEIGKNDIGLITW